MDKLATELNKSKKGRDDSQKWIKNKVKIAKGWMIKSEAERLYNESRKAPYHFDTHQDYLAYDDKVRADTKAQAIEIHKEKDE